MLTDNPLVSVAVITYNQEQYLRQTLDSILMQNVNFQYEIVVGEDKSPDNSRELLLEYAHKNPGKFKLLLRDENLGAAKNMYDVIMNSSGEYIAFLEGDDFWKDPNKLQIQIDFMEQNPEYSECFHFATVIDENGVQVNDEWLCRRDDASSFAELCTNFFIPTASVVIRNFFRNNDFRWCFYHTSYVSDRILHAIALRYGKIKYIDRTMSVYRYLDNEKSTSFAAKDSLFKAEEMLLVNEVLSKLVSGRDLDLLMEVIEEQKCYISDYKNKQKNDCTCIICNNSFGNFYPFENPSGEFYSNFISKYQMTGSDTTNYSCPYCGAIDRERHLLLFLGQLKFLDRISEHTRVLHFAPEPRLSKVLELGRSFYIKADFNPKGSAAGNVLKMDITDVPFKDDYFDLIICNHVLECIIDDIKAMKELFRVLNETGIAILQTPYSRNLNVTYEDATIISPDARLRYFGQEDHVRVYAEKDFFDRLKSVGFMVMVEKSTDYFNDIMAKKLGFNNDEDLIICYKKDCYEQWGVQTD